MRETPPCQMELARAAKFDNSCKRPGHSKRYMKKIAFIVISILVAALFVWTYVWPKYSKGVLHPAVPAIQK